MKITEIPAKPKEQRKIRVAAYARVSSDKDAAFHSLEAQRGYYEAYVAAHPDWELVGLYSDNGITGTTINRPEFKRMLEDCREGKVDLVITKSVTRFARNTVILLETVRELKGLGVDCYFEKEDMHSISPDGELLLTLLAMYAEEEARSASENQKWRVRKKHEQGILVGGRTYGYDLKDSQLTINPEEASVVRRIFALYLSGMGTSKIARTLIEDGVPTRYGGDWTDATIREILSNERYTGDLLLQKTYVEDFRTKKKKRNKGELRQYLVSENHEGIIDVEVFSRVQREIARRRGVFTMTHRKHEEAERLFAGMILCGDCGSLYQRKYTNRKKYDKAIWICQKYHRYGKAICHSQQIPEDVLIEKTKEVLGTEEISTEIVAREIRSITVPEHNHLSYCLKNGDQVEMFWEHRSRSSGWTPEMREKAREKALMQRREEHK